MFENVRLEKVNAPVKDWSGQSVALTKDTMSHRIEKVKKAMILNNIKQLFVYADLEHGSNFEYLVGYVPRFEEAALLIDISGEMKLFLGNENLNKASKARIKAEGIHVSQFSLPNQPQDNNQSFSEILKDGGISKTGTIGLVGWKLFTAEKDLMDEMYDIPSFVVNAIKSVNENTINATHIFIGEDGVKNTNNANEIAYFEFGSSLASDSMLDAMNALEEGATEIEIADHLSRYGQTPNVVTIMASGERFVNANIYPTDKKIEIGEPISMTIGYRGGLSSRGGYAVSDETQLPIGQEKYIDRVAKPYFNAYVNWLETIRIGQEGNDLFQKIDSIFPRKEYGWYLCPGHLTGYDEWSSSPIYENSKEQLKSGMIFQVDIIPSVPGYGGVSAESTIVLADEDLKNDIKEKHPEMWLRMQQRLRYMREELGIVVSKDVLPMCSTVGYLRPYLLNKDFAFKKGE